MRFTIGQSEFLDGLSAVANIVPARTPLPIIGNLHLVAKDDELALSATDLDLSVTIRVSAGVEEAGQVTLPAKKLADMIRSLPASLVRVQGQGEHVTVECESSHFRIHGLPAEDFPTFPTLDFQTGWTVPAGVVEQLAAHTSFAASTEDTRPILNGVLWEVGKDRMQMVATNGHRLAKYSVAVSDGSKRKVQAIIVPPKALAQIGRIFAPDDALQVATDEKQIGFRGERGVVFSRLIEGPYPNYEQVIPRDNDKRARADKERLTGALRRMAVMASDQTHRVRLALEDDMLRFHVSTPDVGEGSDQMPVAFEGSPIEIGFNASYLLEVLRFVDSSEVEMTLKAPERAAILKPVGSGPDDEDDGFLCLVMPLRLQE
ncbi:MAG TPA: DNA polymerase III subunit beta [Gemmatimonadota bacterium]|nr:DNA polymerase III subunit beta [Gemmatimonadota bacterium]